MGMRNRLATVAVARGELALLVFSDATADGIIDLAERRAIRDHLSDWYAASRATDEAGALAHAIACGVDDGAYFSARISDYRAAVDELPETAA